MGMQIGVSNQCFASNWIFRYIFFFLVVIRCVNSIWNRISGPLDIINQQIALNQTKNIQ